MLHTINFNFSQLNHLANTEPLHPEELYLVLAGFCGALLTFSHAYTLEDLPKYRHEQLSKTFTRLDEIIRELLDIFCFCCAMGTRLRPVPGSTSVSTSFSRISRSRRAILASRRR